MLIMIPKSCGQGTRHLLHAVPAQMPFLIFFFWGGGGGGGGGGLFLAQKSWIFELP